MKFKYKEYGNSLRPVVPIILKNKNDYFRYEALVDSGSDHCFFDAQIGESIGIHKGNSEIKEVFGIGGKVSLYYVHPVTLQIGEKSFDIKAGFVPNLGGQIFPYGIVGQHGFFDKFVVKFDFLKEEIELKARK